MVMLRRLRKLRASKTLRAGGLEISAAANRLPLGDRARQATPSARPERGRKRCVFSGMFCTVGARVYPRGPVGLRGGG